MRKFVAEKLTSTSSIVNRAFDRAVKQTGAVVDSETAKALKDKTFGAVKTASRIGKNLTDLNGDGEVNAEDLRMAAEKAGIAWDWIDPDLKAALVSGGVAGVGVNFIPFVGQAIAVPTFAATTAYFFLVAKLNNMKRKKEE